MSALSAALFVTEPEPFFKSIVHDDGPTLNYTHNTTSSEDKRGRVTVVKLPTFNQDNGPQRQT
jgi:hypothetical protein